MVGDSGAFHVVADVEVVSDVVAIGVERDGLLCLDRLAPAGRGIEVLGRGQDVVIFGGQGYRDPNAPLTAAASPVTVISVAVGVTDTGFAAVTRRSWCSSPSACPSPRRRRR